MSAIGNRPYNEDRILFIDKFNYANNKQAALYACIDGHGGSTTAEFLKRNLVQTLFNDAAFEEDPLAALTNTIQALEHILHQKYTPGNRSDGAVLVVVLFTYEIGSAAMYVANVGDARAAIAEGKHQLVMRAITRDHTASDPTEQQRIYDNGGYVSTHMGSGYRSIPTSFKRQYRKLKKGIIPNTRPFRLYPGGLVCSRAIADFNCKTSGVLIAKPDVELVTIDKHTKYVVLASDGLWDVVKTKQIPSFLTKSVELSTRCLIKEAMARKSMDNISVIVVHLQWP